LLIPLFKTPAEPFALRLVGPDGTTSHEGRLEVRHQGVWGTVCDDHFGSEEAHVVCRQLNYNGAVAYYTAQTSGIGQIWLDNVSCQGDESSLNLCDHSGWGSHNCFHYEDVAVECNINTEGMQ